MTYSQKKRSYVRDNCKKLHSFHAFLFSNFLLGKLEIHICLKLIVRGSLSNIPVDWKGTGISDVLLLYPISLKIFKRGLIIIYWRFLPETTMTYSLIVWRFLPIMVFCYKPTKSFASQTLLENRLRFNFETFITFSVGLQLSKKIPFFFNSNV